MTIQQLSPADLERLNTWLPEIAKSLLSDAPVKPMPDGSFRVGNKGSLVLGPAAGSWYDHESAKGGVNSLSLIAHLRENSASNLSWAKTFLQEHSDVGPLPYETVGEEEVEEDLAPAHAEYGRHIIDTSVPIAGTPAEAYLASRSIEGPYPETIFYLPDARVGEGALVSIATGADGPTAVQLCYLDARGHKSVVEPQRRIYALVSNWASQGAFVLNAEDAPDRIVITEGVEDALSLLQAGCGITIMASLGVGNLRKLHVPSGVDIVVFRDGDAPEAPASKTLTRGVDHLLLSGTNVRVTQTPLGEDANSLLQSQGSAHLLRLVEEAEPAELSTDGWLDKCANMDDLEYDQSRKKIAKEQDIRVSTLDKGVGARRKQNDPVDDSAYSSFGLQDIEPWPDPVDLQTVLYEADANLRRYIFMAPEHYTAAVLWAAHTHITDLIGVSPRLAIQSPMPGCGKTALLECLSLLVPRSLMAASITSSSIFRLIEAAQPTLCIDEADQLFRGDNPDLIAIINSSHRKSNAYVWRVEEVLPGQYQPVRFSTWAPIMLAGIRQFPPTIQDRSVVIRLQRALPGEVPEHLRDGYSSDLVNCGRKLVRCAEDIVVLPDVVMPRNLANRDGDNWRPLFQIAHMAGGEWPTRVLSAANAAITASEDDIGRLTRLLFDIRDAFGEREKMSSENIVDYLLNIDDGPYQEANRGRPINQYWLSQQLKGIIVGGSKTIRDGNKTPKGYEQSQFKGPWRRYGIVETAEVSPDISSGAATGATTPQDPETNPSNGPEPQHPASQQRNSADGDDHLLRCGEDECGGNGGDDTKPPIGCGDVADVAGQMATAQQNLAATEKTPNEENW